MKSLYDTVILGASGLVGHTLLELLEERNFPVRNLYLLASERSKHTHMMFRGKEVEIQDAAKFDFSQAQLAFFSAGASVSAQYAPLATATGCLVIDNTSQFRMDDNVPLVVPEVNANRVVDYKKRHIIANPNCSTIQLVLALKPIYDKVGLKRLHVASYQAVSGVGRDGADTLMSESTVVLNADEVSNHRFPKQIAFNAIPEAGNIQADGHAEEEVKLRNETRKILEDPKIDVVATCVRVPVFNCHSEAVHIETKKPLSADDARTLLRKSPGVRVMDDRVSGGYQTAAELGDDSNDVYVGRLRNGHSNANDLCMWIVGDNIRKGAALNSVQIAEHWDQHDMP